MSSAAFTLDYRVDRMKVPPRNPYIKGRLSTVDLLVLTNLDQVLFRIDFFTKQATFLRKSFVLRLPLRLVFPGDPNKNSTSLSLEKDITTKLIITLLTMTLLITTVHITLDIGEITYNGVTFN